MKSAIGRWQRQSIASRQILSGAAPLHLATINADGVGKLLDGSPQCDRLRRSGVWQYHAIIAARGRIDLPSNA